MAPKRESTLDLCSRVTAQGNGIAIRMLEYLSMAKHPLHGFTYLATDFLDLSRLIWAIEAGLSDASNKHTSLPSEVTQDLDRQFRRIHDEFLVVNQMMHKFVDNEAKKKGFGKAFRMLFADTDVEKVRQTVAKSRDMLRVSSAMFRMLLGDIKADSTMGIGYTGLSAALERLNPGKTSMLPPMQPLPQTPPPEVPQKQPIVNTISLERSPMERYPVSHAPVQQHQQQAYRVHTQSDGRPRSPLHERPSHHDLRDGDVQGLPPHIMDLHRNWMTPSAPSVHSAETPHSFRDTIYENNGAYHGNDSGYGEATFIDSAKSRGFIDEEAMRSSLNERYSADTAQHTRPDAPGHEQQWIPRHAAATPTSMASGKTTIMDAVQQKRHRLLEQMLEGGVKMDPKTEASMLRVATQNRDADSIVLLLRFGVKVDSCDKEGWTPLYTATQVSYFEGARLLLKAGADPNLSAGPDGETPLCLAACENRIDLVQMYLASGGDAEFIMESGSTTLVQCMNKTVSPKLVEMLIKSGADPNHKNSEGTTALFQAIQANRIDLMTVLLDNGANPNLPAPKHPLWPSTYKPKALQLMLARGADHKKTPGIMELASSLKKLESIQILMDAGVSPNIRKDGVYTPLCSAIRDNSAEIVTYLLEHGADPNLNAAEYPCFKCITHNRPHFLPQLVAAGADLRSPKGILETAVAHNNKEALKFLLEQNVPINDRSPQGNTALTTAIRDDRPEIVDLLLSNGADPTVRGADWPICMAVKRPAILQRLLSSTPNPRAFRGVVEMAVVANQLDSIKMLLEAGVSVEDKNCGVFSPLTTAIRERHKPIVRYLLDEANADPNAPGEHLPLVKALRRLLPGDTEILQMLLTRGADINKMHRGWNAVLQAVENGDAEILKLLIEKGGPVDLQVKDESDRPVIDIVAERGWEEGMALLFPNAKRSGSPAQ